jgi:hypothetical protein
MQESPLFQTAPIKEIKANSKKTRLSKNQWVKETHFDQILASWDFNKCLAYLTLSESTQMKLPGSSNITIGEVKSVVEYKISLFTNNHSTDTPIKSEKYDLVAAAHLLNLYQSLGHGIFRKFQLSPSIVRINLDGEIFHEDVENIHQNTLRLINYLRQTKS